jgi:hypothetical protein
MIKLLAAAALALALPQDKIDNPQYGAWASCKPGTWVKHKMEMDAGGRKMEMEMTTTLVEVTDEKVVIERKSKMDAGGRTIDMPARREDVMAKVEKGKSTVKFTEKEEEITAGGKTLKCTLCEMEMESNGEKMQGKSWFTKEIPGGMVKGEFKSARTPGPMTLTATGWEKK